MRTRSTLDPVPWTLVGLTSASVKLDPATQLGVFGMLTERLINHLVK
jgi:hypothetical protein